jgi:hypothetical protein
LKLQPAIVTITKTLAIIYVGQALEAFIQTGMITGLEPVLYRVSGINAPDFVFQCVGTMSPGPDVARSSCRRMRPIRLVLRLICALVVYSLSKYLAG